MHRVPKRPAILECAASPDRGGLAGAGLEGHSAAKAHTKQILWDLPLALLLAHLEEEDRLCLR